MRKKTPKVLNTRKNRDSQYTHSKFELPNLNKFIYENMQNRERSTDYNLLYRISKIMSTELKIKDRHINEITKPISEKQTKEVTLQFFKELDQELYEKAKKIIDGNSDIGFNMYMLDGNEDFSKTKSDGMPVHTKIPCVFSVSTISENILFKVLYTFIPLFSSSIKKSLCSCFFSKSSFIKTYSNFASHSNAKVKILYPSIINFFSLVLPLVFNKDFVYLILSLSLLLIMLIIFFS